MNISFFIKEETNLGDESMTITIVKNSTKERSHISNTKKLDDFTAVEQKLIKDLIQTLDKYSSDEHGAKNLNYNI